VLDRGRDYDDTVARFRWQVPARFNIGTDVCDRQSATATALIDARADGGSTVYTFGDILALSNRLANAMRGLGIKRGDRVAVLLPQGVETALSHVAAYKLGAVAVPLFTQFGPDALEYRLADCGARLLVANAEGAARVEALRDRLPDLQTVLITDGHADRPGDFWHILEQGSDSFAAAPTVADDPALIIYTSGTTGPPKGALHAHRVLLGHLPGVEFPHDFFPQPGDRFWTPADWAWIGGLLDVLLPSWHHGIPVVAHRMRKFDPEEAFHLMARFQVRNSFLPPTALKMMRQLPMRVIRSAGAELRSVGSGGESLGEELLAWGRDALGTVINEFYGQTECNLVVGNCQVLMPVRPGAMGRPVPGHRVGVLDGDGSPAASNTAGDIGIAAPDPVMFLRYWNRPDATEEKFRTGPDGTRWLITGDRGRQDAEGWLSFDGRADDVITSGGYRIGPAEIENVLLKHPAVAMAAAIGLPDPVRTEIVTAVVVPADGHAATSELADAIAGFVAERLAPYERPRRVIFADSLPLTATGKIMRRELRTTYGEPDQ